MNLNTFKSKFVDFLPTNRYVIEFASKISNNKDSFNISSDMADLLSHTCTSVNIPSMGLMTVDNFYSQGFGKPESLPWGINEGEIELRFTVDSKAKNYNFFRKWITSHILTKSGKDDTRRFLKYPNTYTTNASIKVYDNRDRQVIHLTISDTYPTYISQLQGDWQTVSYATFVVKLIFKNSIYSVGDDSNLNIDSELNSSKTTANIGIENTINQQIQT